MYLNTDLIFVVVTCTIFNFYFVYFIDSYIIKFKKKEVKTYY